MIEELSRGIGGAALAYGLINGMGYLISIQRSMENNSYLKDWRDHARIGFEDYRHAFSTKKFQIFALGMSSLAILNALSKL